MTKNITDLTGRVPRPRATTAGTAAGRARAEVGGRNAEVVALEQRFQLDQVFEIAGVAQLQPVAPGTREAISSFSARERLG